MVVTLYIVCFPDVIDGILTCLKYIFTYGDHLSERIIENHGFSWLMYLMIFRHECIGTCLQSISSMLMYHLVFIFSQTLAMF